MKPEYPRSLAANPPGGGPNTNLLSFANSGGLLGKGVCRWHSRFTRNALYLAFFLPSQPRPALPEARRIIRLMMNARRVVPIPGYENLREFSLDHEKLIRNTLESRQIREGVLQFARINGLWGSSAVPASKLKNLMDRIHGQVSSKGIAYVKFQTPGLDAHALLVTEAGPLPGGGYRISCLDSNLPLESVTVYRIGDRWLNTASGSRGVPYLQRSGELSRIRRVTEMFVKAETRAQADGRRRRF